MQGKQKALHHKAVTKQMLQQPHSPVFQRPWGGGSSRQAIVFSLVIFEGGEGVSLTRVSLEGASLTGESSTSTAGIE